MGLFHGSLLSTVVMGWNELVHLNLTDTLFPHLADDVVWACPKALSHVRVCVQLATVIAPTICFCIWDGTVRARCILSKDELW